MDSESPEWTQVSFEGLRWLKARLARLPLSPKLSFPQTTLTSLDSTSTSNNKQMARENADSLPIAEKKLPTAHMESAEQIRPKKRPTPLTLSSSENSDGEKDNISRHSKSAYGPNDSKNKTRVTLAYPLTAALCLRHAVTKQPLNLATAAPTAPLPSAKAKELGVPTFSFWPIMASNHDESSGRNSRDSNTPLPNLQTPVAVHSQIDGPSKAKSPTSPYPSAQLCGSVSAAAEASKVATQMQSSGDGDGTHFQDRHVIVGQNEFGDYDTDVNSVTQQLADTAVSVREINRQLARAKVKNTVQSVLIITKARDNSLVRRTRELALWLMRTPRNGKSSGCIVYVDEHLRHAKRFNAAGIRDDYPELFEPVQITRSNSSSGLSRNQSRSDAFRMTSMSKPEKLGSRIHDMSHGELNYGSKSGSGSSGSSSPNDKSQRDSPSLHDQGLLRYWTPEMCTKHSHLFDLVVTLGGDGTVLYASWLFQRVVPPIIPIAFGSLGFLTNFDYPDFTDVLWRAMTDGVRVSLRMRFQCTVFRSCGSLENPVQDKKHRDSQGVAPVSKPSSKGTRSTSSAEDIATSIKNSGGWNCFEQTSDSDSHEHPCATNCRATYAEETFHVLNEVVVDRGSSPFLGMLEIFSEDHHLTTVQADGLVVATPTGSTAYSLSAGGSLTHPEIPAILLTPISPHSLSFRPMLIPDTITLRIFVPHYSRSTAWAYFDGRGRMELRQGDHIKVVASPYPFPTVSREEQSKDWYHAVNRTLRWNERSKQGGSKSYTVFEQSNSNDNSNLFQPSVSPEASDSGDDTSSFDIGDFQ